MLSEAEMKEFFQRVVDEVAQLSTQASQVEGLRLQVNSLSERIVALEAANNELHKQIADANNTVARMDQELTQGHRDFDNERAVTVGLRETIFQRDSRVQELDGSLQTERDSHKITLSERDDARTKVRELEDTNANLHQNLSTAIEDRNGWRNKAIDLEGKVDDLQQRLDKVQAILSPLRVVASQDVA